MLVDEAARTYISGAGSYLGARFMLGACGLVAAKVQSTLVSLLGTVLTYFVSTYLAHVRLAPVCRSGTPPSLLRRCPGCYPHGPSTEYESLELGVPFAGAQVPVSLSILHDT